jgi:hypothetical protein
VSAEAAAHGPSSRLRRKEHQPCSPTQKSDIVLLKEFFGLNPGQTPKEFGAEMKALTPEDKAELVALVRSRLAEAAPAAA